LIDDKKARRIAENFNINCVGTLGILSVAKEKGLIDDLRSIFLTFLRNERYYSINLMNKLLAIHNENPIV
jgi:predicted nucleic acid-binding protein